MSSENKNENIKTLNNELKFLQDSIDESIKDLIVLDRNNVDDLGIADNISNSLFKVQQYYEHVCKAYRNLCEDVNYETDVLHNVK